MRVGFSVYHLVDLLDVAGPFEMLSWAGFDLTVAAKHKGPIQCRGGLAIEADTSFDDAPASTFYGRRAAIPLHWLNGWKTRSFWTS
jgi:putative intracellular protease/amidase